MHRSRSWLLDKVLHHFLCDWIASVWRWQWLTREVPLQFQSQIVFSPLSGVLQLFRAEFTRQNDVEPLLWSGCCCRSEQWVHAPAMATYSGSPPKEVHSVGHVALPCVCSPVISPSVFSALRGKHNFFEQLLPQVAFASCCCVCASALLSVNAVQLGGLSHVLSVSFLLGCLKEISSWDLLCFLQSKSCYCLCEFSLLYPECSLYLLVFL